MREAAVSGERPRGFEWWLGYAVLLATALFSLLQKNLSLDSDSAVTLGDLLWLSIYALAIVGIAVTGVDVKGLFAKSKLLWAFVLLMLLSTAWSVAPFVSLTNAVELIGTTIVAYYLVARYPLPALLDLLVSAFGTIAALSLFLVIFAPGHGRENWGSGAWSGVYPDKNNLGAAMTLGVVTCTISLFRDSAKRRTLAAIALVLCLALLIGSNSLTASLAGLASVALGLIARLLFAPRFGPGARIFGTVGALVIAVLLILYGSNPDALTEMLGRSSSLTGRTDFWPYLIQAIGDHPILGYGYNAFFRSAAGADQLSYYVVEAGGWSPYHAHDSFLQIALDAGFVGLALVIALLIQSVVRTVRYLSGEGSPLAVWPLTIVLYLILSSYTETSLGNYNTVEWILFVAALLYPIRELALAPAKPAAARHGGFGSTMQAPARGPR